MKKIINKYQYSIILLRELVITDFKLRYQGSILGYLWSLLRPLALFVILYIVFVKFLKIGSTIEHFPVYLLTGIVLWNYFAEVTSGAVGAIVGRGDLIRKINFPKYIIVIAGSFSALINLFLNFLVISVFMAVNGVDIGFSAIYAPLYIVELFLFSLGMAFFLSAVFVKFRDINYIWEVIMQAAFYITPILYPLSLVSPEYAKILLLNPMAQIIQDFRHDVITPQTQTIASVYGENYMRAIPVVFVFLVCFVAGLYFRSRSRHFAEEV